MKPKQPSRHSCATITLLTTRKSLWVYVKEYISSGISVAGEVAKPGFDPALGSRRLFDVLQAAGGPTDKAANKVLISHRDQKDATTVYISKDPAEMAASNVERIAGRHRCSSESGHRLHTGRGNSPRWIRAKFHRGNHRLADRGCRRRAYSCRCCGKTRLLRRTGNGFQEQRIDLKKLLRGKAHDVSVQNDDILFIPSSAIKTALSASALVAVAASTAIYRVPSSRLRKNGLRDLDSLQSQ